MFAKISEIIDDFLMFLSDIFFSISVWLMPQKSYSPFEFKNYDDYITKISGM